MTRLPPPDSETNHPLKADAPTAYPTGFVRIHHGQTAWIVLGLSLFLTITAAWMSYAFSQHMAEQRFDRRTAEVTESIRHRLLLYEQALWGGVGLFDASDQVTRKEFMAFVTSLNLLDNLPGIQGLGYSTLVAPEDKVGHEAAIRAEGFPTYEIRPPGQRERYTSIVYLEPFDWRNQRAFGFDMWSNDMRREAMTRACDTGKAANSGCITLVQETTDDIQRGFLMYTPVYRKQAETGTLEQRREALEGWVYSPFRGRDLMKGILGQGPRDVEIEVYDGEKIDRDAILFDSDGSCHIGAPSHKPKLKAQQVITLQGRPWTLYIHQAERATLANNESWLPFLVGGFGLLIDLLLFMVIFSLQRLQKKTSTLARSLHAQKHALEVANHDLSQFANIASHDLQEPLRTISNFASLIEEDYGDKLDDEGRFAIRILKGSTSRMRDLIHAVLEYSKIGKVDESATEVDVTAILEEIQLDMGSVINESGARIECGSMPNLHGTRTLLRQLFTNLISNAIKYQREGIPPHIKIWGETDTFGSGRNSRDWVTYHILDNGIGIGIEEEHQERIFEIFRRLHRNDDFEGTGIGLASCRKIVDLHHGTIQVRSAPDEGSAFSFSIPTEPSTS